MGSVIRNQSFLSGQADLFKDVASSREAIRVTKQNNRANKRFEVRVSWTGNAYTLDKNLSGIAQTIIRLIMEFGFHNGAENSRRLLRFQQKKIVQIASHVNAASKQFQKDFARNLFSRTSRVSVQALRAQYRSLIHSLNSFTNHLNENAWLFKIQNHGERTLALNVTLLTRAIAELSRTIDVSENITQENFKAIGCNGSPSTAQALRVFLIAQGRLLAPARQIQRAPKAELQRKARTALRARVEQVRVEKEAQKAETKRKARTALRELVAQKRKQREEARRAIFGPARTSQPAPVKASTAIAENDPRIPRAIAGFRRKIGSISASLKNAQTPREFVKTMSPVKYFINDIVLLLGNTKSKKLISRASDLVQELRDAVPSMSSSLRRLCPNGGLQASEIAGAYNELTTYAGRAHTALNRAYDRAL